MNGFWGVYYKIMADFEQVIRTREFAELATFLTFKVLRICGGIRREIRRNWPDAIEWLQYEGLQ